VIQLYFQNASTATGQTINVAGRGPVPIKSQAGGSLSSTSIPANTRSKGVNDFVDADGNLLPVAEFNAVAEDRRTASPTSWTGRWHGTPN